MRALWARVLHNDPKRGLWAYWLERYENDHARRTVTANAKTRALDYPRVRSGAVTTRRSRS